MNLLKKFIPVIAMFAGAVLFMVVLLYLFGVFFRPDLTRKSYNYDEAEIKEVQEARSVSLDVEHPPVVNIDVDYSQGKKGSWYPKGESPVLAELVAEGKLPPVHERVGSEPVVMRGADGIGQYGGTWNRVIFSEADLQMVINQYLSRSTLARWSPYGYPIKPHLAKGWKISGDLKEYTVYLRKGLRWSDGHPLTTKDIKYWWECEVQHWKQKVNALMVEGEVGAIEFIDDYTVKFKFTKPNGQFLETMALNNNFFLPEHYLRQFHPDFGDSEKIRQMMKAQGVASARASYTLLKSWRNTEYPTLWPWIMREHQSSSPYTFVRNPYYWAVDTAGNQLPYIDRLVNNLRSGDMLAVSASSGDVSMQYRHIRFEDHTLYMQSRKQGGYDVYFWYRGERSNFTAFPNLYRRIDSTKPETIWKNKTLADKRFRQALSLAINRRDIIQTEYAGIVEPAQFDPGRESPFHNPNLFNSFTQYDSAGANRLLDEIGLTRRDDEGFRMFPDGTRMTFFLNMCEFTGFGPSQFMIDDWRNVGVRVIPRMDSRNLWRRHFYALEHDMTVWTGESEFFPLVIRQCYAPQTSYSWFAPAYGYWYQLGGLYGDKRVKNYPSAIEPPVDHPARRAMVVLDSTLREIDLEKQKAIFKEVTDIAAENVWAISNATPTPQLVIVKKGLRNVPKMAVAAIVLGTPSNTGFETYYFDNIDGRSALSDNSGNLKKLMVSSIPDPRLAQRLSGTGIVDAEQESQKSKAVASILKYLMIITILLFLVMIIIRHPFVARRIVVLIPTLLLISICVFTIIQLPPGDYVTARIQELEMTGDESAAQQMKELKELFNLDKHVVVRYLRWIGLPWFVSFEDADKGLLQGFLGRSMEDSRSVNDIVGDRIMLTIVVSLFTILFTWAVAIPIGLYSAVRQYSIGDYFFTFVGFIGMCVPPMLLALILMYIGSAVLGMPVGGLFSPEYALQPEWSWGKFVDLMKHIWIPVIVVGAGGTAGMIRVLRANMLDELGKPYVTTARAKGVRPIKLLLKYPFRLALNPFISGIGSILPNLISGGAIVGIVLSLPIVGPLQLSALQAQDMYLAGSMLMVLSLLTVIGTLISDMLLMWVDPRIRMTGG